MHGDITVPEGFAEWKLTNPSPQEQLDYFRSHTGIKMPSAMWNTFYCTTLEHRGFHCSGCMSDEEYNGWPNFDDMCCCLSELNMTNPVQSNNKEK